MIELCYFSAHFLIRQIKRKIKQWPWRHFLLYFKKFKGKMRNLFLNTLWKLQVKKLQSSRSFYWRIFRKIWRKSRFKYFLYNMGKKRTNFTKNFAFLHQLKSWSYQQPWKNFIWSLKVSTNGKPCQISSKVLAVRNLLLWAWNFPND